MSAHEQQPNLPELPAMWTTDDGRIVRRVEQPLVDERAPSSFGRERSVRRNDRKADAAEITDVPEKATMPRAVKWAASFTVRKLVVPAVVMAGALPVGINTGLEHVHMDASKFPTYDMQLESAVPDLLHDGKVTITQTYDSFATVGHAVIGLKNLVS
jgi:hypothetical protein